MQAVWACLPGLVGPPCLVEWMICGLVSQASPSKQIPLDLLRDVALFIPVMIWVTFSENPESYALLKFRSNLKTVGLH
ncbi:hypothetical protein E6H36_11890 [Candidatus Bathyarchaeota archaeon]|nr:MAG: hypothetical protein E6H36_11890 [Candidatus Bathyarchaeota archaeon]